MRIILVRHGQAEDEKHPDSARQLTDFGQQQALQTAEYITAHYNPDYFIVSPYKRAQQTLAKLQSRLPNVPSKIQQNITPSDDAHAALIDLANIEVECLVVVCHMSIIANIAGLLTNDYPESFSLAEARVFDMEFVMTGMATEVDHFVPVQPY